MDFETYKSSLAEEAPPEGLSMAAQALAPGPSMRAEAAGCGGRLGARLSAPRRRRPAERRRLVQPRRPAGLDRTLEGGMGDDRPGAPRLAAYSRAAPPEGTLAAFAVSAANYQPPISGSPQKPWFTVRMRDGITARRTAE